jgi:hypothetical protein
VSKRQQTARLKASPKQSREKAARKNGAELYKPVTLQLKTRAAKKYGHFSFLMNEGFHVYKSHPQTTASRGT